MFPLLFLLSTKLYIYTVAFPKQKFVFIKKKWQYPSSSQTFPRLHIFCEPPTTLRPRLCLTTTPTARRPASDFILPPWAYNPLRLASGHKSSVSFFSGNYVNFYICVILLYHITVVFQMCVPASIMISSVVYGHAYILFFFFLCNSMYIRLVVCENRLSLYCFFVLFIVLILQSYSIYNINILSYKSWIRECGLHIVYAYKIFACAYFCCWSEDIFCFAYLWLQVGSIYILHCKVFWVLSITCSGFVDISCMLVIASPFSV